MTVFSLLFNSFRLSNMIVKTQNYTRFVYMNYTTYVEYNNKKKKMIVNNCFIPF